MVHGRRELEACRHAPTLREVLEQRDVHEVAGQRGLHQPEVLAIAKGALWAGASQARRCHEHPAYASVNRGPAFVHRKQLFRKRCELR